MPLQRGTKLGPYQIESPIGAGGMGEVYKATDTRLERTVAIKVLPAHVASDPERKQRFEREAKVISGLNHPHICTLYEFDNHEGTDFLVMEYLEGETLADRLSKGALPLDQALRYAIEIADALDKAHRQGVTHRDLKPANIMLTKAGSKLLDFGLAKLKPTGPQSDASTRLDESLTQQGTILGTFRYMAPEQLEGQDADARTDIWAFGCVVYEMVTGKKAFEGKSQASLISAIMKDEPRSMASLQPMSPPMLDQVIRICLAKDPDERWQSAGDIGRQLKLAMDGSVTQVAEATATALPARTNGWQRGMPFALGVSAFLIVVTGLTVWNLKPGPPPPSPSRFVVITPSEGQLRTTNSHPDVAISPDGMRFVYTSGTSGTGGSLYVRHVDQLDATFLRGTEDGQTPFFSPDGEWVGFTDQQDRSLKKVSILGGPAVTIADTSPVPRGLSWGRDDYIVFATGASRGLLRVPAVGGEAEQLTTVDPEQGETDHWWPDVLPNGKGVLFTAWSGSDEGSRLAVVSLETREVTYLLPGGSHPRYSPTGHIVYGVGGTLRAVGFDAERLELTSSNPVPVVENVNTKAGGAANFGVANNGSLVYVTGEGATSSPQRTLVWVDRARQTEPVGAEPGAYRIARISPDGTRVAVDTSGEENDDVWIYHLARNTLTRLTFDAAVDDAPLWTPDGSRVVFQSAREGGGLFWKAADGTGEVERLLEQSDSPQPHSWSADGRLVFDLASGEIGVVAVEGDRTMELVLDTEFLERQPAISPDGRWMAYFSNESGQNEVYVRPFPNVDDGKWQVSGSGGREPVWSPDGRELFFVDGPDFLVAQVETEPTFSSTTPEVVFARGDFTLTQAREHDISPDGEQFLFIQESGVQAVREVGGLILVQNWFTELERLVPTP